MRSLLSCMLLLFSISGWAQNTIYSYAMANWKDGPVVYISPLMETTEAFTTPQLLASYKEAHPEFRDAKDVDVLRFATQEEGEESRQTLKRKYGVRKLDVVMLQPVPSQKSGE